MKKLKLFAAALVAASTLSSFSPLASAQEKTQVTFWHAMNGAHEEALTALTDKFNESQDKVEVVLENQGDYKVLQQKVMGAGVSGDLPTMSQLTASTVVDFMDQGLTEPLNDYLTEENGFSQELLDDIYPGFMTGVTLDDQVYGLPFSKSVRVMYVNQDLLDELGVEVPKTWDDVKALGEKLDEAGKEEQAMGLENSISMEVETMARQNGAVWIADDKSATDIASDKATEPVQFIKDLIADDHARLAGEDGYMSGPFASGATALYIGSSAGLSFVLDGIKESGINVTTAEIPTFADGNPLTLFAGNDLGVFSQASDEEKAAAVQYMAFLLSTENTAEWAAKTGYLPITKSGEESDVWQNYLKENPLMEAASKELEYGRAQVPYVGSSEVFTEIETALETIMVNDGDVKENMQAIEDLVKGHLGL
ncbi:ABC transporter substrate-binding protein [Eremococcus coleocola]|uniref:ABC transporter substrate-binding protein n=1 Tax=Eremococcus coleocola TaxID=88132 RepID=UPI000412B53C|nr:ABC transporter substrate-binding protein [Eremococcus coleocola]